MATSSVPSSPRHDPAPRPSRREGLGLSLLFGALAVAQGIDDPTEGLPAQPVRSLLGSWGRGPAEIAAFSAIVSLPWLLKPLFGLISDFVPLAGMHRKSYLVVASGATAIGFLVVGFVPPPFRSDERLLGWLLLTTAGVAWTDVAADALMVERGRPLGMTGRLQAVQWASLYASGVVVGVLGGELAHRHRARAAFLVCAGAAVVNLAIVLVAVREPARGRRTATPREGLALLRRTALGPRFLGIGGFLFLWNFNPFSNAVLHIHMTRGLGFGESFFGRMSSLSAAASVVASIAYVAYCRRIPLAVLAHGSVALGVVSTLGYGLVSDERSATIVTAAVGFTYMTATLIQLDLAARACPPAVAGTVFAILMALENLAATLSVWLGGVLYERGIARWGSRGAFLFLVVVGATITASCWLLLLAVPRAIVPVEEGSGMTDDE